MTEWRTLETRRNCDDFILLDSRLHIEAKKKKKEISKNSLNPLWIGKDGMKVNHIEEHLEKERKN